MRSIIAIVIFLFSFTISGTETRTERVINTDLRLRKVVTTPQLGAAPAKFDLVVTNVGTADSGPITLTDTLPPGLWYDTTAATPSPWLCTYLPAGSQPNYVVCTHPGPLAIGNSVVLPLAVQSNATGSFENCAVVTCDGDPNPENNEDCACTNFKQCDAGVDIDISSGVSNGQALAAGSADGDWQVATLPGGTPAASIVVPKYHSGFADAPPAQWLSLTNPQSEDEGEFAYTYAFALPPELTGQTCSLALQYAADNYATVSLDGSAISSIPNNDSSSNFTATTSASTSFTATAVAHALQIIVGNTGGPTSLLVNGTIHCSCQ
jgi:uncharacterized repeat protein (TIGR01451 family)